MSNTPRDFYCYTYKIGHVIINMLGYDVYISVNTLGEQFLNLYGVDTHIIPLIEMPNQLRDFIVRGD